MLAADTPTLCVLTPILIDGTMNVILSPSEVPQRNRRAPAQVAGVPLCQ
jgi:hypothetical protein